jgi:restriction system protein
MHMPIPDFQSVMRPLMDDISDGKEHAIRETLDRLGDHFKLTEEERKRLLPSGRQEVFTNRVAWAKTHLRMAGLIEPTTRGVFKITARGLAVLKANRDCIDLRLLRKQPGYLEARDRKRDKPEGNGELVTSDADQTPEELMEQSFEALRESLGREILAKLKSASPASRSHNVDTWCTDGWQLRVMYDEGERATNLVQELIMRFG